MTSDYNWELRTVSKHTRRVGDLRAYRIATLRHLRGWLLDAEGAVVRRLEGGC